MSTLSLRLGLLALICLFSTGTETSMFYPATLREAARRNAAAFPWAADIRQQAIADARPWLEMPDENLWSLMFGSTITRSWMVWSDGYCPACKKPVPMYNWRIEPLKRPWKVACPHCNEVFPKNDFAAFYRSGLGTDGVFDPKRADRSLLFNQEHPDPRDPLHTYGVDDGEGYPADGHRWRFIGAYLVYGQFKQMVLGGAMNLASAYVLTGQTVYAHKAAVLLDRVADLYPTFDYATQGLVYEKHNGHGYVSIWHDACEETRQLALAYDAIRDGLDGDSALVKFLAGKASQCGLSNGKSSIEDIRRNIEQGILRDALAHVPKITSNYPRTDSAIATIHTILDPAGSRQKVRAILDDIIDQSTAVDGTTGEKGLAAYSALGVQALAQILALCDRMEPGFLEDMIAKHPALRQTWRFHVDTWFEQMYYPNAGDSGSFGGRNEGYAGIRLSPPAAHASGDCWDSPLQPSMYTFLWRLYQATRDADYLKILYLSNKQSVDSLPHDPFAEDPARIQKTVQQIITQKGSRLEPPGVNKQQWHLALLRSGRGADALAAWLDYDVGGRHSHADGMNLGLFAKGLDLMPDFGYPPVNYGGWGSPRARWYTMSAAHNTVVVDGKDLVGAGRGGVLGGRTTLWGDGQACRVIRASCPGMIRGQQFERTVAVVDVSDADSYIVDLFRVVGGTDHAKFMHSGFGQIRTTGLALEPTDAYGHDTQMREFRRDSHPQPGWSVDWQVEDRYKYLKTPSDVHLRYTDLTPDAQALTCEGWVLAGSYESSEEAWIPRIIVRRQSKEAPLASTFVGVIEPYEGKSNIRSIRRLDLQTPEGQPFAESNAAVEVTLADGRRDLLISADVENPLQRHPAAAESSVLVQKDWRVQFNGDLCVVRRGADDKVERVVLCHGRSLTIGDLALRANKDAAFMEVRIAAGVARVITGRPEGIQEVTLGGRSILERKAPASRGASQPARGDTELKEVRTDMGAQPLLGGLSAEEVNKVIAESMGKPVMPYLHDANVRQRAIETARRQGLLAQIDRSLTPDKPIPVLPYSRFREFRRNGNRSNYEKLLWDRDGQQASAIMACYLGVDRLQYLQDLMWADCEASWWMLPAHEGPANGGNRPIDLCVAMKAANLAIALDLLGDRVEPEVRERVLQEIRRRAIDTFVDPAASFWWKTCTNNWNAVCHGGVGIAALLVEKDPQRLSRLVTQTLQELPAFLSGFTDDGGCNEGPGYWTFGFGWYVDLACALYDFTGGRINIMADPKVERICRYPLAVGIAPGQNLPFSDTEQGFVPANLAIRINRFHKIPELYGLCKLTDDGSLAVESLADLLVYDGTKYKPLAEHADSFLPDLGVARVRSGSVTVGAKAGHNAESHNHNDVGSFVIHKGMTFFLTDPGAPIYSARTFSPQRYDSIFCNSFGHSLPVINGQLQPEGRQYAGTIQADGLNASGAKIIRIEMARAYDVSSLETLSRTIELAPAGKQICLSDRFVFAVEPESLEEAFITTLPAKVSADGKSVTVQSEKDGGLRLRVDGADGTFGITELTEESKESPVGDLLRRITFRPAQLKPEMTLRFVATLE